MMHVIPTGGSHHVCISRCCSGGILGLRTQRAIAPDLLLVCRLGGAAWGCSGLQQQCCTLRGAGSGQLLTCMMGQRPECFHDLLKQINQILAYNQAS